MSHYKTLGLVPGTSREAIRAKYKQLAMVYHPDRPNGDIERFQEIKRAYEGLMRAPCPLCSGTGHIKKKTGGVFTTTTKCPDCWK